MSFKLLDMQTCLPLEIFILVPTKEILVRTKNILVQRATIAYRADCQKTLTYSCTHINKMRYINQ